MKIGSKLNPTQNRGQKYGVGLKNGLKNHSSFKKGGGGVKIDEHTPGGYPSIFSHQGKNVTEED